MLIYIYIYVRTYVRMYMCGAFPYYAKDPLTGSICARQTHANGQIRNRFLWSISLLLKCVHISTHRSSAGFHQHSTVRPSLLRNTNCVCPHTLYEGIQCMSWWLFKSYGGCFILSMCFLVNDRAIIRPRWLCDCGQIRCPAIAAIILSRTMTKEQTCGRN